MWGLAGAERRTCWCFKVLLKGFLEGDEASILGAFFFLFGRNLKKLAELAKTLKKVSIELVFLKKLR